MSLSVEWTWIPPTVVALLAVVGSFLGLAMAWKARHDVQKLHIEVNSRLSELLEATRLAANGVGHARGIQDERTRQEKEGPIP